MIKFLLGVGLVAGGWSAFQNRDFVFSAFDWQDQESVELAVTTSVITAPPTTRVIPEPPEPALALPQRADTRNVALPKISSGPSSEKAIIEFSGGSARLAGTVSGPDGLLPGAVVRIDRVIDEESNFIDIVADEDGEFEVTGLPGGRYRVRSWREPDLAMLESRTAFLSDDQEANFELALLPQTSEFELKGFTEARQFKQYARPIFGVTVRTATVGSDGRVYLQGAPNQLVRVVTSGALANQNLTALTDSQGIATLTLSCPRAGSASITFSVGDQVAEHPTPSCQPPPPPPTTAAPRPAPTAAPRPAPTATPRPQPTTPPVTAAPTTATPPPTEAAPSDDDSSDDSNSGEG